MTLGEALSETRFFTREIYKITIKEVIKAEGVTEGFVTNRGVTQACPLSPTLFNGETVVVSRQPVLSDQ